MANKSSQSKNLFAIITYALVLVSVVLMFVLPIFGDKQMLAKLVPATLNTAMGKAIWGQDTLTGYNALLTVFGYAAGKVNLYAWSILAVAVFGALGVFFMIPVCLGKKAGVRFFVYFTEVMIAIASGVFVLCNLYNYAYLGTQMQYALLIPFGASLVMLLLQGFVYKKSSGVMKCFLFFLSAVATFALFPVLTILKQPTALDSVVTLFKGTVNFLNNADGVNFFYAFLQTGVVTMLGTTLAGKILSYATIATVCLVLVNLLIDAIALATKATKFGKAFNLARYSAQLAGLIVVIVCAIVEKQSLGFMLLVIALVTLVELLISIFRYVSAKKKATGYEAKAPKAKKEKKAKKAPKEEAVDAEEEIVISAPLAEESVVEEYKAPAVEVAPVAETTPLDKITLPDDTFIATLTASEKVEFYKTFIAKEYGSFKNIPDYEVGGENKNFFTSVFIYLSKFRNYLSDGLLNKIYKQLNLLK